MKAGCYCLNLTCDHPGCARTNVQFTGEDRKDAFRQALRARWQIADSWTGKDLCPKHRTTVRAPGGAAA